MPLSLDLDLLDADLRRDEGEVLHAYDDSDGAAIKPGVTVRGNVTVGIGTNVTFLYPEESRFLYVNRRDKAIARLTQALPWFASIDGTRQRALVNLIYNVDFLKWPHFIGFAASGDWEAAANCLENTHPWIDQVNSRGHRIAALLRSGDAPKPVS